VSGPTPLAELTQAITEGLTRPRHAWQALVIALALLCGWILARAAGYALARVYRGRLGARHAGVAGAAAAPGPGTAAAPAAEPGARANLPQLLFPFLALALLWIGEGVLRIEHVVSNAADARLLRLAASLIGTLAVVRLLFMLLRRVLQSTVLVTHFERAIAAVAILGMGLYATGVLVDVLAWLDSTDIPLGSAARVSLWSILVGSATTLGSLLAAMWLGSLIEERLNAETAIEPNMRTVLARVARALVLVIAVLFAMAVSGIDLTILSVFGGALGVGLGLGLQRIASNYVSGFILLLERRTRIGDMITVDKFYGRVTQISSRYTAMRTADGIEAIVPNEMLVSLPVVNSTVSDRKIMLAVQVEIGPHSDLGLALRLLREAAQAQPRVLSDPAPLAMLTAFRGGNLALEIDFAIADPENGRQNIQSDVGIALYERFRANGIEFAVPRGDFQVFDESPVRAPAVSPDAHK